MQITISTWMLLFFILFLIMSIWKIWAFLPNKQLADDDKTQASEEELNKCMLQVIRKHEGKLTSKELFKAMIDDENFDKEHFWRFNENRLIQMLNAYYAEHPNTQSIKDIFELQSRN